MVHLPPLFNVLAILAASLIVALLVGVVLAGIAFMHMDSGPEWLNHIPIPAALVAGLATAYITSRFT